MTQLNPITGNPALSSAAQRLLADDKAAQMRRAEQRQRSASGDSFESQIQNLDEVEPTSDQSHQSRPKSDPKKRKPSRRSGHDQDRLDIRA